MNSFTPEQIDTAYQNLDPELKAAMNSVEQSEKLQDVCELYNLSSKFSSIQKTVALVILGLLSLDDFKNYINLIVGDGNPKVYNDIFNAAFGQIKKFVDPTAYQEDLRQKAQATEEAARSAPQAPPKEIPLPPKEVVKRSKGQDPYREAPE